jgi:hemoglobin-like flavoprotein
MTPTQIILIQSSWEKVLPAAGPTAELFYQKLFAIDPSLRGLFPADLAEQQQKLMQTLGVVVKGLTKLEAVVPAVQALGKKHANYGVHDAHYEAVGAALLATLEAGLADDFTPELRDAWTTAYGVLAKTMQDAARAPAGSS